MPPSDPSRIVVTGGAGFIGSALVRQLIAETDSVVHTVDSLTYAGDPSSLGDALDNPRHTLHTFDIGDATALRDLFAIAQPDAVIHLAAETHVDRSIDDPSVFVHTNLVGTFTLLEEARRHWRRLDAAAQASFRFVHVSTDEVFGSLGAEGRFTEQSAYDPRSPYAATKAGADHLARAWWHTYRLPVIVTNCTNNYGPCQYPEKLIPRTISHALAGEPIPVYARGENVRDWLHVDDHARALRAVLERGEPGATYAIGAENERRNIDVVRSVCRILDALRPQPGASYETLIEFVDDRPGHDFRYAIDSGFVRRRLGWAPTVSFDAGLRDTVAWYLTNAAWMARAVARAAMPVPSAAAGAER